MPFSDRDYVRGKHPPSCTCVDCCEKRLKQLKKEVHSDYVSYCPRCGQKSFWHNLKEQKYECLNLKCKYVGSSPDKIKTIDNGKEADKNQTPKVVKSPTPNWLRSLLLIFSLTFIGLVISTLVGSIIPFCILFGFSVIFSIEKWFSHDTRKHKWLGRLYRLIINLGILSLFGLVIWSGIKLFSHQFVQSVLMGSILFVAEFVFFIWLWRIVSKNSWRWPSMKLTTFTLICLFLVFAFAGVQPMSSYKDAALSKIQPAFSNGTNNQPATAYSNNLTTTPFRTTLSANANTRTAVTTASRQTIATVQTTANGINPQTGVYKNYYLGLANFSGNGCYDDTGNLIVLINNKNAVNPTYNQLISFLQQDKTDQFPYNYILPVSETFYGTLESHVDLKNIQNIIDGTAKPGNPDICADFAERLHNDAEIAGIKCAYVSLDMTGYTDPDHLGIPSDSGHALDAFQTTDRGLVYIDDTGWLATQPHPSRAVKTVNTISVGQVYAPISLFPEAGWQNVAESMGMVTGIQVIWDGTWNN